MPEDDEQHRTRSRSVDDREVEHVFLAAWRRQRPEAVAQVEGAPHTARERAAAAASSVAVAREGTQRTHRHHRHEQHQRTTSALWQDSESEFCVYKGK